MFYSFIVPAFNRVDEIRELLESMTNLQRPAAGGYNGFEVIIADGSPTEILKSTIEAYTAKINVRHVHRPKLSISPSRNLGAEMAAGDYLIFLDSDVILPPGYLIEVHKGVTVNAIDAYGGPDKAHQSFTDIQKAISYAMTALFTTGGIRGGKKHMHNYNPRGFNMGIRKSVFQAVNGYSTFVCGEDIELSIRIIEGGYNVKLIPEAYVFHKRRTSFKSFFRQVFRFGAARINIFYRHRKELKLTHLFPSVFLLFLLAGLFSGLVSPYLWVIYVSFLGMYFGLIFIDSSLQNKSLQVGVLSVVASVLQLCGYGAGLIANAYTVFVKGNEQGIALGASK